MKKIKIYLFLILLIPLPILAESMVANDIAIEGNLRVTDQEIIEYSGYDAGKVYNSEQISLTIKSLFSTNLFKDIEVTLDNETLYIKVKERAIISKLLLKEMNYLKLNKY